MKSFLFLPFALLVGLFIGGWSPREELRVLRKEIKDLNQQLASREKESRVDVFTRMVKIPDRAAAKPKPKTAAPATALDDAASPSNAAPAAVAASSNDFPVQPPPQPAEEHAQDLAPENLQARIEEAKELWATRVQIAREQWINRMKLTPEGVELFDASINAMNAELLASMQGLADTLAAGEEMTPELGTRFFNEMTTSLVQTYNDFDAFVPAEQRGEATRMELTDFIDPAVAEPLIAVQDKLENMPRPGGGSGSGRRFPRLRR